MTLICRFCLVVLAISLVWPFSTEAQVRSIGQVRTVKDARIVRAGLDVPAIIGSALQQQDTLSTGHAGSIGFVLNDNSVITLGPDSKMTLTEFQFEPQEGNVSLIGEILSGTMEYISGKISKISKDAAKFRTPYTTVAARGTRLLVSVKE
jgi:hypothetical protein